MFTMLNKKMDKNEFFEPNFKGAKVLTELISTVGVLGEDETIRVLNNARKGNAFSAMDFFCEISRIIYEETQVKIELVRDVNRLSSESQYIAVALACRVLQNYCKLSKKDLQKYFNKDRTSIYKYEKYLADLHPVANKKTIQKVDRMEQRIREQYNFITQKQKNG